jgi:hypothetical protein
VTDGRTHVDTFDAAALAATSMTRRKLRGSTGSPDSVSGQFWGQPRENLAERLNYRVGIGVYLFGPFQVHSLRRCIHDLAGG